MNATNPFTPAMLPDGSVVQAGVYSGDRTHEHALGAIVRAVVLATYYADDPGWEDRPWARGGAVKGVCCDVRTYGRQTRVLTRVPVLQLQHGIHDHDWWVPRPSRQSLTDTGVAMAGESGAGGVTATAAHDLDGDHVLVAFLEGDWAQPVILPGGLGHPASVHRMTADRGRVREIRHHGVAITIDDAGNVTVDATGAAQEELGAHGIEQSTIGAGGGTIVLKTKTPAGQLGQVTLSADGTATIDAQRVIIGDSATSITLGGDSSQATEPFVLGAQWQSFMVQLLTAIQAITVVAAGVPTTPPVNAPAFAALQQTVLAGAQLSSLIAGKKTP